MKGSSRAPGASRPILPRWWVAVVLLGVGLVAGVLLVGLLNTGRPDFATAAAEQGSSGATSTSQPGDIPIAAEARVNAACLRVINEAQAVTGVLTGVPGATQDVDLQRLDDLVRRLQPLQPRLAAGSARLQGLGRHVRSVGRAVLQCDRCPVRVVVGYAEPDVQPELGPTRARRAGSCRRGVRDRSGRRCCWWSSTAIRPEPARRYGFGRDRPGSAPSATLRRCRRAPH